MLKRKKDQDAVLDLTNIPNHIAIIMDGNGRWANKRGLPRVAGHHEGMKVVKKVTKAANKIGVKVLTMYAFSTENWKRPKKEVEFLMNLPEEFLGAFLPDLKSENVKVQVIGDLDSLPTNTVKAVTKAIDDTKDNTGLILNFALNYGSRFEILSAVQNIYKDLNEGNLNLHEVNETTMSKYLMTNNLPDPDLLIRTSGEIRLSNFLLWQLAYSEFWFTDTLWPDFSEEEFYQAIKDFQSRGRRFGGIEKGDE